MTNSAHLTEESLFAYLHNLAAPDEMATLRSHLAVCSDCSARLESEKAFEVRIMTGPVASPSLHFTESVVSSALPVLPARTKESPWLWYSALFALVLGLTLVFEPAGSSKSKILDYIRSLDFSIHLMPSWLTTVEPILLIVGCLMLLVGLDQTFNRRFRTTS